MRKSVAKFYGEDRMFDYDDFDTKVSRRFVKKRSHKQLRRQLLKILKKKYIIITIYNL